MSLSLPTPQLILDYGTFLGLEEPAERLSLLQHLPQREIIAELAGLNYRLKPRDGVDYLNSYEQQVRELKWFLPFPELFARYRQLFDQYSRRYNNPVIFTRATCLFAVEEILKSDLAEIEPGFVMNREEVWKAIFKYLLCVNSVISKINNPEQEGVTLELVNAKILALNELLVPIDPIYFPYRGYRLLKFFLESPEFDGELAAYLAATYGLTHEELVHAVMSLYMANRQDDERFDFMYQLDSAQPTILPALSRVFFGPDTIKLVSLRKYPFSTSGDGFYCLVDNAFLLEKIYSQFIHDFWFDWLKPQTKNGRPKYNISNYRSKVGYFLESYLAYWLRYMFGHKPSYRMLLFDQLKLTLGKDEIELADIYIRDGNRVLIGQVKSGSIYDNEKFGGDIEVLYKGGREQFFVNFGVQQLVDSIQDIHEHMNVLDKGFPKAHVYEVYPCIIVNDKVFQTPIMANVFNSRFQELLNELSSTTPLTKVKIRPLTLLHVGDVERMAVTVRRRPKKLWELLQFSFRNPHFIPPFYNTLNQKLPGREYSDEVKEVYYDLIRRFSR